MTSLEIIQKVFSPKVFKSTDIDVVDHFAIGCVLIAEGRVVAGLKTVNGALALAGCKNNQYMRRIRRFVEKHPKEAFQAVNPHMEIMSLFPN